MYAIQKKVITLFRLACAAALATVFVAGDRDDRNASDDHNASKAAPMKFVGTYYSLVYCPIN